MNTATPRATVEIDRQVLEVLIEAARLGQSVMNNAEELALKRNKPGRAATAADHATATNWAVRRALAAIGGLSSTDPMAAAVINNEL